MDPAGGNPAPQTRSTVDGGMNSPKQVENSDGQDLYGLVAFGRLLPPCVF